MARNVLLVGHLKGKFKDKLKAGDEAIKRRLEKHLHLSVTVQNAGALHISDLADMNLVILSESAAPDQVKDELLRKSVDKITKLLREEPIPVVVLGTKFLEGMKMATIQPPKENNEIDNILTINEGDDPFRLTAGLKDRVKISDAKRKLYVIKPEISYHKIAHLPSDRESIGLFAYERGDLMIKTGEITAPARRVAYMLDSEAAAYATEEGWKLFDAAVKWAVALKTFDEVFAEEWLEIKARREKHYQRGACGSDHDQPPKYLVGLALSGGGIRSATFSLGLLQGFHKKGLLRLFDYLSTVSGGGYTGGWWSAWLSRHWKESRFQISDLKDINGFLQELTPDAKGKFKTAYSEYLFKEEKGILTDNQQPALTKANAIVRSLNSLNKDEAMFSNLMTELLNQATQLSNLVGPSDKKDELLAKVNELFALMEKLATPMQQLLESWKSFFEQENEKTFFELEKQLSDQIKEFVTRVIELVALMKAQADQEEILPDQMNELLAKVNELLARVDEFLKQGEERSKQKEPFWNQVRKVWKEPSEQRKPFGGQVKKSFRIKAASVKRQLKKLLSDDQQDQELDKENHLQSEKFYSKLNSLILEGIYGDYLNPPIFPPDESLEPERMKDFLGSQEKNRLAEGSLSAGSDPIHHLRLFSNYLTPRKGAFSGDTWRAVAVIFRNLLLTWLCMLPILFAFVLAGQLIFVLQKDPSSELFYPFQAEQKSEATSIERQRLSDELENLDTRMKENNEKFDPHKALKNRARWTAWWLAPFIGWILLMIAAWMRSNVTKSPFIDWLAHTFASLAFLGLFFSILRIMNAFPWPDLSDRPALKVMQQPILYLAILWFFAGMVLWFYYAWPRGVKGLEWRKEVRKNRVDKIQAGLMITAVCFFFVLVLSGFGYEFVNYIWFESKSQIVKAGGYLAVILSLAGSVYTAIKAAPTGGDDKHKGSQISKTGKLILFLTPPLVLGTLAVMLAWVARHLFIYLDRNPGVSSPITAAALVGIGLCLFFAIYELRLWRSSWQPVPWILVLLVGAPFVYWVITKLRSGKYRIEWGHWNWTLLFTFIVTFVAGLVLAWRFYLIYNKKMLLKKFGGKDVVRLVVLLVVSILLSFGAYKLLNLDDAKRLSIINWERTIVVLTAMPYVLLMLWLERLLSTKNSLRSLWLTAGVYLVMVAFLLSSVFNNPSLPMVYLHICVMAIVLCWTIALGWMSDPNWLSLHLFYKSRLVRAYLGASNSQRQTEEITQSAGGDDLLLYELNNCQTGGPYHIINATLNLVGGKDLVTAQRSSASFELSQLYCGSLRTGYRKTRTYMDGRISLGGAVAVSGAAVSPNMGAKTQTAALSMLLTLLNVRLGCWAPTPDQENWRAPQAHLWPYYMLKEFVSQTNDLSSFCYLTDGGHFDNTGLYSLVERGCRYIILADNGADPLPCFEDLGDAIRRCRIDFGAEIELGIAPFFKQEDETSRDQLAGGQYVVGTITYNEDHLRGLRWTDKEITEEGCTGVIILIKPALLAQEGAEIRQYARQHKDFPTQSTGDQWFDEAQFESYRRLGQHCAEAMYDELGFRTLLEDKEQVDWKPERNNLPVSLRPEIVQDVFDQIIKKYENRDKSPEPETQSNHSEILSAMISIDMAS